MIDASHGVPAADNNIDAAYANSVAVEEGVKIAFYARQIGIMSLIPKEECESLRKTALEKYNQKNYVYNNYHYNIHRMKGYGYA